jgi:hypothetical protein
LNDRWIASCIWPPFNFVPANYRAGEWNWRCRNHDVISLLAAAGKFIPFTGSPAERCSYQFHFLSLPMAGVLSERSGVVNIAIEGRNPLRVPLSRAQRQPHQSGYSGPAVYRQGV